jgi:hypothetical protein
MLINYMFFDFIAKVVQVVLEFGLPDVVLGFVF